LFAGGEYAARQMPQSLQKRPAGQGQQRYEGGELAGGDELPAGEKFSFAPRLFDPPLRRLFRALFRHLGVG